MSDGTDAQDTDLFVSLILNFQVSAMIGMGKIVNPVTQKAVRNLDEAKVAIDMLNMLENKMKGNLSSEEDRLIQQTLTDLRINFVNEKAKPEPVEEQKETVQAQTEETEPAQSKKKTKDKKKPKAKRKKKE